MSCIGQMLLIYFLKRRQSKEAVVFTPFSWECNNTLAPHSADFALERKGGSNAVKRIRGVSGFEQAKTVNSLCENTHKK